MRKFLRIPFQINNWLLRLLNRTYVSSEIMILLPRCLQASQCKQNVGEDSTNCRQCGHCRVGDIVRLGKEYGITIFLATGGSMARAYIKEYKPKLIIAVACGLELLQGMVLVFPHPVYAICNSRPNGPCKNTHVEVAKVEEAIKRFMRRVR